MQLPDGVIEHIYSDALDVWYRQFFRSEEMRETDREAIEEAVSDVYHKRASLDAFVRRCREVFGNEARGTSIAVAILGNDFLHIEDWLGIDIAAYITMLGGDPAAYRKEVAVAALVEELADRVAAAVPDPVAQHRLCAVLESLFVDARTIEQTVAALTRSTKIGGAGLEPAVAQLVVDAAATRKQSLVDEHVRIVRGEAPGAATSRTFTLVRPARAGLIQPEDDAEIAAVRAETPQHAVLDIPTAVDRVMARCGAQFQYAETERRFRAAVASRLRDVRDHVETREVLLRSHEEGGVGIARELATKALRIIADEYRQLHGAQEDARGAWSKEQGKSAPQEGGELVQHGQLAPTTPVVVPPKPKAIVPPPPPPAVRAPVTRAHAGPVPAVVPLRQPHAVGGGSVAHPTVPSVPPALPLPQPPFQELPPPHATSQRAPTPPSVPSAALRKPQVPGKPAPSSVPAAAHHAPSPPVVLHHVAPVPPAETPPLQIPFRPSPAPFTSLPAAPSRAARQSPAPSVHRPSDQLPGYRARIMDVRPPRPRLVGPVEELEQLTIDDFRKIAPDSVAAATRIIAKLDLLARQSFVVRANGIAALRRSPLMAAYADALNTAIGEGRSVEKILEAGKTMTMQEYRALMDLNAQLRV